MKIALTLDGKTATSTGDSKWITGEAARHDVAAWRRYFPAIAVGANTILGDDPSLTSRQFGQPPWCPRRFILDSNLRTFREKPAAKVFQDAFADRTTVVISENCDPTNKAAAMAAGVSLWELPVGESGQPEPEAFIGRCGSEGLTGVYMESGEQIGASFLSAGVIDYLFAYTAPIILGDKEGRSSLHFRSVDSMSEVLRLKDPRFEQFGEDRLVRGFLK
jgi:diaminohydroxyphosphoribosylaminopyrimidine deaminase/5-amino-6-(5-phosphoribosylamino)uracil reductase